MSAVAVQAAPHAGEASASALGRELVRWLRKNIPAVIISTAIGFVVGFVTQTYVIAIINQGLNGYQGSNDATPHPSGFALAFLVSGVATTVAFGVFGYLFAVGPKRFAADVRKLPGSLLSLFTRDGNAGRVHLLWGAAASLVATTLISPAVGAMLAVGLLASAPGVLGRTLSTLMMRIWSQVLQRVAPTRKVRPPGVVSMSVGVLGASAAMLISYILPAGATIGGTAGFGGGPGAGGVPTRLVIAVGFAVLAFVLSRTSPAAGAAVKFLIVAAGVATMYEFLHPLLAHATDGGFAECGNPDIARYLLQCQGSAGVAAVAAAGGVGGGAGAAAGFGLGQLAAQGGANDMGGQNVPPDTPPQIPPQPPIPHFPHVFMRGNQLIIECANGVQLSATVNPDGTTGPWSATNLNTQSGGAVQSQVTGDDGAVTTYYTDGSTVTKGTDGSVQTWTVGADGTTYTVAQPGGDITTTHPDNSVDVRSPDGTITTTYPGGGQVIQYPDGSSVQTAGGTTVTQNADGTVDVTQPDGTTQHRSSDGTVVTTDAFGNQTVQNPDGTVTVTNQDGTSATKWPDGSWEATAADGTKTIHNADGTTYVHNPDDQGVVTYNPDGSRETRMPDGTVSVRDPQGAVTTWSTDGLVGTTYPNGMVVSYDPHGNMNVSLPGGQDMGDPNALLHNLDDRSGYINNPSAFSAVAQLQQQLAANGGQWTPQLLASLAQLQAGMDKVGAAQDAATAKSSQDFADAGMQQMVNRLNNEKNMQDYQKGVQAFIDNQQAYIRSHLSDLPVSQWQGVEDALNQINGHSPNAQDANYLSRISHSMFNQAQGVDPSGGQLSRAVGDVINPPPPPQAQPTDLRSLIYNQQQYLIGHMDDLPPAQRAVVQNLIDKNYTNPTLQDLTDLQRASHATNNVLTGGSEAAGAQAQVDALNAQAAMVATQRVNALAQGTGMAIMLPVMAGAGVAALGNAAVAMGYAGQGTYLAAGLGAATTFTTAITLPGAAVAAGHLAAFSFGAQAVTGGISGYMQEGPEGGLRGAVWGTATASLPVNTIAAVAHGEGAKSIAMSAFQDVGNVMGAVGATHQVGDMLSAAVQPGGALNRLFVEPTPTNPLDAAALADKTNGMRLGAELRDAQIASAPDDNFHIARGNLEGAQAALALDPQNPQLRQQVQDARAILNQNPSQQRLAAAADNLLSDYQGRIQLKNVDPHLQQAYIDQVNLVHDDAMQRALQKADAAGITRGGQPLGQEDLVQLRNRASTNAPADNDIALNEMHQRELEAQVAKAPPGSDEAAALNERLRNVQAANRLEINGRPVSNDEWNQAMQHIYDQSFRDVTGGRDPHLAQWEVTQRYHGEAYPDLNVLKNDPVNYPLDPAHAETTGGVTDYKARQAEALFNGPDSPKQPWNAQQEIARGAAKDIETKLLPLIEAKGGDPDKIAQIQSMSDFLGDVGKGHYSPTQADAMAQKYFGADSVTALNQRTAAALTVATKWQPPAPTALGELSGAVKPIDKMVLAGVKATKIETGLASSDRTSDNLDGR